MEQKYIEELKKLNFTADIDSVPTVLETRTYHNTFDTFSAITTDCSYAILVMPTCFDEENEKFLLKKVEDLFSIYYSVLYKGAVMHSPMFSENSFQIKFNGAMEKEQIVAEFLKLLDMALDGIHTIIANKVENGFASEQQKLHCYQIETRLKVIRVFIEAGLTTYEYNEECYDWLE